METDVCGLVLSVDIRVDQMFLVERGAWWLFREEEQHLSANGRVASSSISRSPGAPEVDGKVEGEVLATSVAEEADSAPVSTARTVATEMLKQAMPEMLRLGEYFGGEGELGDFPRGVVGIPHKKNKVFAAFDISLQKAEVLPFVRNKQTLQRATTRNYDRYYPERHVLCRWLRFPPLAYQPANEPHVLHSRCRCKLSAETTRYSGFAPSLPPAFRFPNTLCAAKNRPETHEGLLELLYYR